MTNKTLTKDYISRSQIRFEALKVLLEKKGYADVVREAQEIVELVSKALLRHLGAEPARVHDVSTQLLELRSRVAKTDQDELLKLIEISRDLRRDRELAFYGTEDLTPSEFYTEKDAVKAFNGAEFGIEFVVRLVQA